MGCAMHPPVPALGSWSIGREIRTCCSWIRKARFRLAHIKPVSHDRVRGEHRVQLRWPERAAEYLPGDRHNLAVAAWLISVKVPGLLLFPHPSAVHPNDLSAVRGDGRPVCPIWLAGWLAGWLAS